MPGPAANSLVLLLLFTASLMGQVAPTPYPDAQSAIGSLHEIARELADTVRVYYADLSDTIGKYDRGYQPANAPPMQGADNDFVGGPADVMWTAVRKLVAFRLLAVRGWQPGNAPAALRDMDRIQDLILEARRRVDASTVVLRRLLVVPAAQLDRSKEAVARAKREHTAFLKARAAAANAAMQALTALPVDQSESGSKMDRLQKTWDWLGREFPRSNDAADAASGASGPAPEPPPTIPIRLERHTRVTLVREPSFRIAITDSGTGDGHQRHIFYEEEWVQRSNAIVRYRWRVAVDMKTGQHVLLKRYPPVEMDDLLRDVYGDRDRNSLWTIEPPKGSVEPAPAEVETALAKLEDARQAIEDAAQDFRAGIREALARQDQYATDRDQPVVDSDLPEHLRQTLFAIRAHNAKVNSVMSGEKHVHDAIGGAEESIWKLEPLIAWANTQDASGEPAVPEWDRLLERAEREVDLVRDAEANARAALPPASPKSEDHFPALAKNTIVRIRGENSKAQDGAVRCLEEVWRLQYGLPGIREVRRVVSLIRIDPKTGRQTRERSNAVTYRMDSDEYLESVYDEYSADAVSLGGE